MKTSTKEVYVTQMRPVPSADSLCPGGWVGVRLAARVGRCGNSGPEAGAGTGAGLTQDRAGWRQGQDRAGQARAGQGRAG